MSLHLKTRIRACINEISHDTGFLSYHKEHKRLDEIVLMGEEAVPYLIDHLKDSMAWELGQRLRNPLGYEDAEYTTEEMVIYSPRYAIVALTRITGATPTLAKHRGRILESCKDWIRWYKTWISSYGENE